jgi:hypothetical protein
MFAQKESTRDAQDIFAHHFLKQASLASMIVTALDYTGFHKLQINLNHKP